MCINKWFINYKLYFLEKIKYLHLYDDNKNTINIYTI